MKQKAAEYYAQGKEPIKENSRERYKNLSQEKNNKIKEYQRKRYRKLVQYKKEALKNKCFFFLSIKNEKTLYEKTLKFNNIRPNKKEFNKSKQPIDLMSVNVDQIILSGKFKHSDEGFKYFIGYQKDEIVKPFCIILPQMSGYIKYLKTGAKTCLFLLKLTKCGKNMNKFGMSLKINYALNFIVNLLTNKNT